MNHFTTCLLILHSLIVIGSLWSLCILISSVAQRTITRLAGSILASLIMCSTISFPVAAFISTNNSFKLCPSFNSKELERQLLYKIWSYTGSFIICPGGYYPIYYLTNSSYIIVYWNNVVRESNSFGAQLFSIHSIFPSVCLTYVDEASGGILDVWLLSLFGTQQITTMKGVMGNSGRLRLVWLPPGSPKSISGCLLPHFPFFLTTWTSLAHCFKNISTHCCQIPMALSTHSKCSQFSKVTK